MMKLKIISFNIKNNFSRSKNEQKRLSELVSFLRQENADIVGLQEVNSYAKKIITEALTEYQTVGKSRFTRDNKWNEYNLLLFKKERVEVIEEKTVWLHHEVKENYVRWGVLPRICTYATFLIDKKESVVVFNTHLDVLSASLRKKQLTAIIKRVKELDPSLPLLGMGDFNLSFTTHNRNFLKRLMEKYDCDLTPIYETYPVKVLTRDSWWRKKGYPIDYFLLSSHWKITYFSLSNAEVGKGHLSDHIPLICEMEKNGHIT